MRITKIIPPKFYIGRRTLNEYELLKFMLEVAQGLKPDGIVVRDEKGGRTTIRPDGRLYGTLYRFNTQSQMLLDMLFVDEEKRTKMKVKRIQPPHYDVDGLSLNEYELRSVMADVAEGKRDPGIKVSDQKGGTAMIEKDGSLSGSLYGLDICSGFTMTLIRRRRERREASAGS